VRRNRGRQLRRELDALLSARGQTLEDAIRSDGRHQATEQAFVSSLVGSLRLVATFDWTEYFESVSLVEQVLRRDPVGVYSRMDFQSRDRYRHAVEEMAAPTGEAQLRVALKAVERARQVAEKTPGDRRAHVGHFLIGGGRPSVRKGHRLAPGTESSPGAMVLRPRDLGYLGTMGWAPPGSSPRRWSSPTRTAGETGRWRPSRSSRSSRRAS
jgi:cyclic beta-1,2-glucan synthetase